ncbi:MAG: DNA mismatch repair protein MutS [Clostridia bacterium]|nr:DNA mismatch repair protein MutS [Clostridia bacterium]
MAQVTPMMAQYLQIKETCKDAILFFRLGDFYEMFFDDAEIASSVLNLALTGKDCGLEERAPMCGVPYHSAQPYIAKLVREGFNVAICEQTEEPSKAKKIVNREIVRTITAGTAIEENILDSSKSNFLCSVSVLSDRVGLSFVDISTGKIFCDSVLKNTNKLTDRLFAFEPKEVLFNEKLKSLDLYLKENERTKNIKVEKEDLSKAREFVSSFFDEKIEFSDEITLSLYTAISYIKKVRKNEVKNLLKPSLYSENKYMSIDATARKNLELVETLRGKEKRGSLLWVLDKTKTAMGNRKMRFCLDLPSMNLSEITKRQNAVYAFIDEPIIRDEVSKILSGISDTERLITTVFYGTASARDLRNLSNSVKNFSLLKEKLENLNSDLIDELNKKIDPLDDLYLLIEKYIKEDPPFSVREGGLINDGADEKLDELRHLLNNGKTILSDIEKTEKEKTGISKLKIGYNRVFGYYIEVLNSSKDLVPENYIRKQTLSNCERYITEELKNLEAEILSAKDKIVALEYEIFAKIREKVAKETKRVQDTSDAIAYLDVLVSFAKVAVENNYTCPDIKDNGKIVIKDGRHPVVEKMNPSKLFVPNDTNLDNGKNQIYLITGPNMAGKSTYMRQVALITIMAQMGSFVPAKYAEISLTDAVFTRIGASDDLNTGLSTFMVEMKETAEILKSATSKSLVVLDEIGRGTSTFDGMSIAASVIEYLATDKNCNPKTLFATHYKELTELENRFDNIKNYHIVCKKRDEDIIFLRKIVRGAANASYGIDVARLAGVPEKVVSRAKEILKTVEHRDYRQPKIEKEQEVQMSFEENESKAITKLKNINVDTITPIEAMKILYELKEDI